MSQSANEDTFGSLDNWFIGSLNYGRWRLHART